MVPGITKHCVFSSTISIAKRAKSIISKLRNNAGSHQCVPFLLFGNMFLVVMRAQHKAECLQRRLQNPTKLATHSPTGLSTRRTRRVRPRQGHVGLDGDVATTRLKATWASHLVESFWCYRRCAGSRRRSRQLSFEHGRTGVRSASHVQIQPFTKSMQEQAKHQNTDVTQRKAQGGHRAQRT